MSQPDASSPSATRRVLWAATVRTKSLDERLQAIAGSPFTHMSVFPVDFVGWRDGGMSDRQIGQAIREANVEVNTVDPYMRWTPGFTLDDYPEAVDRAFVDHSEDDVLRMAAALATRQINVVSAASVPFDLAACADQLGKFVDRAGLNGLSVTLEFMPISNVYGLREGLALVNAVARDNLALCFDTWHFHRSEADIDLLRTVPGKAIAEVQLADARLKIEGDLFTDLMHYRRVPGEGEFDLPGTVEVLKSIGAWRSVGPEIFSDEMDRLQVTEAVRRAAAGFKRFDHPEAT